MMSMGKQLFCQNPVPKNFNGAKIQGYLRGLGYGCALLKGDVLKVQMPLRHAILAEGISGKLAIETELVKVRLVKKSDRNGLDAILKIQAAGDASQRLGMFRAVNSMFYGRGTKKSTNVPEPSFRDTGFIVYQMEWKDGSCDQNLVILPGGHIMLHLHKETGEKFFFIDPVIFKINGQEMELAGNSGIFVPVNTPHGTAVTGSGFILARAWKDKNVPGDFYLLE